MPPASKGSKPKKPNPEKIKARIEKYVASIIETEVIPYAIHLLDKAQAKTVHELWLSQGMGHCGLDCASPDGERFSSIIDESYGGTRNRYGEADDRLREKFPELVELLTLACSLDEFTEDVYPSVLPRKGEQKQDPIEYVVRGPIVQCTTKGCTFSGTEEWDMFHTAQGWKCEDCHNNRKKKG